MVVPKQRLSSGTHALLCSAWHTVHDLQTCVIYNVFERLRQE